MRALIVGADGFAGRWLARELSVSGTSVWAVVGPRFAPPIEDVEHFDQLDVRDADAVSAAVVAARPDVVYYLAGVSRQGDREDLAAAAGVSLIGSLNVLIGCARAEHPSRLLFVSTGYVYAPSAQPISEASPVAPASVYASAKLAAENALLALAAHSDVEVVVARPFNHIGPGQGLGFLVPEIARQIVTISADAAGVVRVADATVVRDFTDVRDVVRAYRLIAERGAAGAIYNVASGTGVAVETIVHEMATLAGINVRINGTGPLESAAASENVVGDATRLEALGWSREYALTDTLGDVLTQVRSS